MPYRLNNVIEKLPNVEVINGALLLLRGVASLSMAQTNDAACFSDVSQLSYLRATKAPVIITTKKLSGYVDPTKTLLIVPCVKSAYVALSTLFIKSSKNSIHQAGCGAVHDTARVSIHAKIASDATIGPYAVIEDDAKIGQGCYIGANTRVGRGAKIGENSCIESAVTICSDSLIGSQVSIDSGVVIGATPYSPHKNKGQWQLCDFGGRVIIADHVGIGSNTTIDAGVYSDTLIGQGVKLDGLVKVGHDVVIGDHCAIVACAAIGANSIIGKHCMLGGGCSIAGNLSIADDIVITGMTTVTRSLKNPGIYSSGTTAEPHHKWRHNVGRFHHLNMTIKKLRRLATEIEELKKRVFK